MPRKVFAAYYSKREELKLSMHCVKAFIRKDCIRRVWNEVRRLEDAVAEKKTFDGKVIYIIVLIYLKLQFYRITKYNCENVALLMQVMAHSLNKILVSTYHFSVKGKLLLKHLL